MFLFFSLNFFLLLSLYFHYRTKKKVAIPCMLWGAGTAIGEIPPYALSRAAREAGQVSFFFSKKIYIQHALFTK